VSIHGRPRLRFEPLSIRFLFYFNADPDPASQSYADPASRNNYVVLSPQPWPHGLGTGYPSGLRIRIQLYNQIRGRSDSLLAQRV
jgi:hypothetical protein